MEGKMERDWQGKPALPLLADESAPHWTIEPYPGGDFEILAIRSWQDFIEAAKDGIEQYLDGLDEPDVRAGVTFTVKLSDLRPCDIVSGDD